MRSGRGCGAAGKRREGALKAGRILRVHPSAGVAGDMMVGALVDAGAPFEAVRDGIARLGIEGLEVGVERVRRCGIEASRFLVRCRPGGPGRRRLSDIEGRLAPAPLPDGVRSGALRVFRLLFEAEGRAHGRPAREVHLHEAGGWDALADVVGTCLALDALGVEEVVFGPVNVGRGLVETSHGTYPLPAPAAAECLRGVEVFVAGPEGETATPTGTALLAALGRFEPSFRQGFRLEATGYGAGSRDPEGFANVLQVLLGRRPERAEPSEDLLLLQTNLDDCDPRVLGDLPERLGREGALDAWLAPLQMKKGRPGTLVSALVHPREADRVREALFRETTTLGVREFPVRRRALERDEVSVGTPWGTVRVKVGRFEGRVLTPQPEYEDCRRLAEAASVPVREVIRLALAAWSRRHE